MIMGGEVYLGASDDDLSWTIGRQLGLQIAAHILSPFGIRPILDKARPGPGRTERQPPATQRRPRQPVHPHDRDVRPGLAGVNDAGAQVSLAFPIEMNMRHGMPPILKCRSLGIEPSLSVDVECTLTADFFTQMRASMNLQRALVNQMILDQGAPTVYWDAAGRRQSVADAGPRHAGAADDARCAALCHHERSQGAAARRQDRLARRRARRPTSSSLTPPGSTWRH